MQEERREKRDFHLSQDNHSIYNNTTNGNKNKGVQGTLLLNRWQRISLRTQKEKSCVFSNLLHHINAETLKEAYEAMDKNKALGVDKVSIACFEDKLVDWTVAKVLNAVYDKTFIRNSFGFRPDKSAHNAIEACHCSLKDNKRPFVVEIDFSNFFNTIPHKKLMSIVKKRIADYRFNGLVRRFLQSCTLKSNNEIHKNSCGTPQGGLMSPILANIYLDEVVDKWFLQNYANYNSIIVRYADDAVFFFKKEDDAREFMLQFKARIESYGLLLNKEKTKTINFHKTKENSLNFLGFTLYWGEQNKKHFLKVKTQKEKLHRSFKEFYQWIKTNRNSMKLQELWSIAKSKLQGHYNYFGYWMNRQKLVHFYTQAIKALFKWLNRRSQKSSYNWTGFNKRLEFNPLPTPPEVNKLMKLGKTYGQM